jgi:hypothetical protein
VIPQTELGSEKICLKREYDSYQLPAVASCQYIRTLCDVESYRDEAGVGDASATDYPIYMVFEWMEHNLRTLPSDQFRENSNLPRAIAKSVLSALALLKTKYGAIHTGKCLSSPTYQ